MPELDITDEQASFLDALRDAIEDELVGPYGTVHRRDALQYLIDNYGEPDELLADGSAADVAGEETDETVEAAGDAEGNETEGDEGDPDQSDESGGSSGGGGGIPTPGGGGDGMLNEMLALMDEHDDRWTKADSEETKYEVELPDGSTETVQTQDDVRALLFKNYR